MAINARVVVSLSIVLFLCVFFGNIVWYQSRLARSRPPLDVEHMQKELVRLNQLVAQLEAKANATTQSLPSCPECPVCSCPRCLTCSACPACPICRSCPPPPPPVISSPALVANHDDEIAILVFTFNRAESLKRTLQSVLKNRPEKGYPLFISQDGNDEGVANVIRSFPQATHLHFNFAGPKLKPGEALQPHFLSYYKIASHYEFGLGQIFDQYGFKKLIILEDDMDVAPDFFSYFRSTAPLLDQDPTLFCVSAWNDNGHEKLVFDPTRLYRTDVFPGLGWMLRKELWLELKPKWTGGFWDDWLRVPEQRKDRSCIRPEINRVYTFGANGASGGQFFNQYLAPIKLNNQPVKFEEIDLSYLVKTRYDSQFLAAIKAARAVTASELHTLFNTRPHGALGSDLRVVYQSLPEFDSIAMPLGIMVDHKSGLPRTSYLGVVNVAHGPNLIYLVPGTLQL
eukprot:TRINITY_DN2748_c0_g1_i2.p1 TRINITY_DN2748_c0_g1~~TRINITY_DN2748_c0_g1_i2.p1  ORF type:complete len:455 (+),score=83.81 TRINITY_DN2748_c0_g1_i2:75-1439(+)